MGAAESASCPLVSAAAGGNAFVQKKSFLTQAKKEIQFWPSADEEKELVRAVRQWRQDLHLTNLSSKGFACYEGCNSCGIGHRSRRAAYAFANAWAHGQALSVRWPSCGEPDDHQGSWGVILNTSFLNEHYAEWVSNGGTGSKEDCVRLDNNEVLLDEGTDWRISRSPDEIIRLRHPATQWFYALGQIGLRHTEHFNIVQNFVINEFSQLPVVAVHL